MINYKIEIADAHAHLFQLTLTIPAPAEVQALSLPVWIPGSYMVREFSRHLGGLHARQGSRTVALRQTSKCSWEARCSGRGALVVSYQVYAFDSSVRAAFVDAQRGFFNGASLCLRAHGKEAQSHGIELSGLPEGWQVATSMMATGVSSYQAADYDELIDHPFELGRFWRGEFSAAGVRHQLVVSGALPVFDGTRLLADTQRICEAQIALWHGERRGAAALPFERYVFLLNAVDDGYGGLEHRASTALIAARRDLPVLGQQEISDGYVRLLGLISHEYFHTWNVKRLRPDTFASFDYSQENYTELLWFFEGFTSYYDDLMLRRCGLIDEARYLKLLSATISAVLAVPGRKQQSLAQASFDAWIRYYRQDENTPNSTVSYYAKGALLALALDLSLRSQSQAPTRSASLDEVLRQLWQRSGGGPISEADILAVVAELGGAALAEELRQWVHSTDDLPLPALLERVGVRWCSDKASLAQRLGLRVGETDGIRVKQVLQGSAALAGGLAAGDEIVACNGWRLRKLDEALQTLAPERLSQMALLVARDQRMLSLNLCLPLQAQAGAPVRLSPGEKAPARALGLRRAWLGS
ncbi:PDZ domain-containing protein [Paucibacter sp. PLA-PC-4]|uniref:M61 family metallopeptidase n=1 Tax=Paucibacter sp. PLA-PC-4 TaxID=2993655 RepID=UPI002248B436|nr:PDZ domain-containing protein [Paucibacter sp. PLA-PC-4]MCX2861198.1 PDZ domain-containing protein [Paucibacter sp. PLA-PC-4]